MEKIYKNCQSCGMPINKDPEKGGTNADGSKSGMYCSYCYTDGGIYTTRNFCPQMKEFCTQKMVEMKIPRFLAKFYAMGIPRLERWRN